MPHVEFDVLPHRLDAVGGEPVEDEFGDRFFLARGAGNAGQVAAESCQLIAIDLIQANVITPIILGRRLTLNPVAIFVGLLFWTLIWGVAGAFLAVPLLATVRFLMYIDGRTRRDGWDIQLAFLSVVMADERTRKEVGA